MGKPSPNPEYPQEVKGVDKIEGKVVGKNLFDINQFLNDCNQTLNNDGTITLKSNTGKYYVDLPANDNMYIEYVVVRNSSSSKANMQIFYKDGTYTYAMTQSGDLNTVHRIKLGKAVDYILVLAWSNITVKDIRIVISQTTTDYQPYMEQSISHTLSKPLYRLSDTVYDYIDLNKGKIVRNVGIVELDGSDDEEISKVSDTNINVYQFSRAINSIEKYAKYSKCDSFQVATSYTNDLLINDNKIYTATISCYLSFDKMDTVEKLRAYLQQNPITVYYQLATPTEEDIPTELLTQLQSLKTYYPQTNIIWNTEVEPYINFDYKLNLPAWLEDKDNKDIIYDKKIETNQKALENQLTSEELDNQSIIDIDYRVTCLELDMEEQ